MAIKAEGFQVDKLSAAKEESLEIRFIQEAVTASMQLYEHRAKEREKAMRLSMNTTKTLGQALTSQLHRWDKGEAEEEDENEEDGHEDRNTDVEAWDTTSNGEGWLDREEEQDPEDLMR